MKKFWTVEEIRQKLVSSDPQLLGRAILALHRCHTTNEQQGFNQKDAQTGVHVGRLLSRGFRLTDLPAHHQWAKRELLKYAARLTQIANGDR